MRITILGMGNMGQAFAARGLERGHDITVWNRSPGRTASLASAGAHEADTLQSAVASADVVLVVLADDAAVLDVCLGDGGVIHSLPSSAIVANVSTVAPATVKRLAASAGEGRVLDSPVMGSPKMIADGYGGFLIGGSEETIKELEPLWTDLGSGYTHCGPLGSGATLKLVSNLLLITGVAALAEGIQTARQHGIPDDLIRRVLGDSAVVSMASKVRFESLMDDAHPGWFPPALARKDLRLALDLASEAGIAVQIGPATETLLTKVIDSGAPWPDFTAVIQALDS